jgi:hypothetical protein
MHHKPQIDAATEALIAKMAADLGRRPACTLQDLARSGAEGASFDQLRRQQAQR